MPGLSLFYFEGASVDARENRQTSEDFLAYRYKDDCLVFVVCDGVQQSIDASLAARLLGISLLDVLPAVHGNKKKLESYIEKLRTKIESKIIKVPIDEDDPAYSLHVRARGEIGAQVKFACGVVDFQRSKIDLYWAGDVRFIVYGRNSNIEFSWENDNGQFWSTKGDYALDLSVRMWDINEVSRLAITSDGIRESFKEILGRKYFLSNIDLVKQRYEVGVDDIAGVDITVAPTDGVERLSNLGGVNLLNGNSLVWSRVPGAEKYRIYYTHNESIIHVIELDSRHNSYSIPGNLEDGTFYVQAMSSHALSSELSKPVNYVSTATVVNQEPMQSLLTEPELIKLERIPSTLKTKEPVPVVQLSPLRKRLVFGSCLLSFVTLLIFSFAFYPFIAKKLIPPTLVTATKSPSATVVSTITLLSSTTLSLTTEPTLTYTPELDLTPSVTSVTTLTLTVILPSSTVAFGYDLLDACQRANLDFEPSKWTIYMVDTGDTFINLAQIYNTDIGTLVRINCYEDANNLIAGKYILVPSNP